MDIKKYDDWRTATPDYYDNETYECDCCSHEGPEEDFTEVFDDGRQLWICESCLETERYK